MGSLHDGHTELSAGPSGFLHPQQNGVCSSSATHTPLPCPQSQLENSWGMPSNRFRSGQIFFHALDYRGKPAPSHHSLKAQGDFGEEAVLSFTYRLMLLSLEWKGRQLSSPWPRSHLCWQETPLATTVDSAATWQCSVTSQVLAQGDIRRIVTDDGAGLLQSGFRGSVQLYQRGNGTVPCAPPEQHVSFSDIRIYF